MGGLSPISMSDPAKTAQVPPLPGNGLIVQSSSFANAAPSIVITGTDVRGWV
jgi:hypothetical protein